MLLRLFLLLGCAMAWAAPPAGKIFPYTYTQEDLPNGLRLISVPTDYPNLVAVYVVVQTGSRNEVEPGRTGFAHLFEHLMFKGTEKFPQAKAEEILKRAGAASNAFTTEDFTCYHNTFSKEDLETILMMMADNFQNLKVSEAEFKTEALAVLGEYNKNSANPGQKLEETVLDTAYDRHTYKHTVMGFLKDVKDMPSEYTDSLQFFDRYYRPEYTTVIAVGDIDTKQVRGLTDKYWGGWKHGSYRPDIPPEPAQQGPRANHVDWTSPTMAMVDVAYKAPAYSDTAKDSAALDVLSFLAFSPNSDLYQKLVVQEQKVASLGGGHPDTVDPSLFEIRARVKNPADLDYVRGQIFDTVRSFQGKPVDSAHLDAVKKHLRYSFARGMDNNDAIANTLARYVALRRTPETINQVYDLYAQITAEDVQRAAAKYLVENGRTVVTLTGKSSGGTK